jgi:hypothetical protein
VLFERRLLSPYRPVALLWPVARFPFDGAANILCGRLSRLFENVPL